MINLNEKYNPEKFASFLREFLPEDYEEKEQDIADLSTCKVIKKVREIGRSPSLDVTVLEMQHEKDTDPRVAIATDAFKLLALYGIDKALVVFNNNSENYRFSYLTIKLDLDEKNKIKKTYSNPRRYSFYLGEGAKIGTPRKQLITKGKVGDINDLLSRFSLEVVNKEFYLQIADFFDSLVSADTNILEFPKEIDEGSRKNFAVRLIGRVMFCWFLKQKRTNDSQLIPENILSSKAVIADYYHEVLERLFFEVLNTPLDDRDVRSSDFDRVPYLNGGLFNPQSDDFYEFDRQIYASRFSKSLKIDDDWFKKLFELLEMYNFTIDENTIFDQELSVDPEMLGRIFENLLAEINPDTGNSERSRTGSYYTPREIVEYMVDNALVEHIKTTTGISIEKINALVSYDLFDDSEYPLTEQDKLKIIQTIDEIKILDPACGSGAFPIGLLQKIIHVLHVVDPDGKAWKEKRLQSVPELFRQRIEQQFDSQALDYIRKLEVIKNSIFGVDIQPIAVEVSRLRCFLTLIVEADVHDERKNRGIESLPNLDFKFVCANTLIPAPQDNPSETQTLFGDDFEEKLSVSIDRYFGSSGENKRSANNEIHKLINGKIEQKINYLNNLISYDGDKKIESAKAKQNKQTIAEQTWDLKLWDSYKNVFENKPVGFFEIKYFFPRAKDGFDIVIANPPYVSINQLAKNRDPLLSHLKSRSASLGNYFDVNLHSIPSSRKKYPPKPNLYSFFFVVARKLLIEGGVISFIVPKNLLTAKDLDTVRHFLLEKMQTTKLVAFNEGVFIHTETTAGKIATSSLLVFAKKMLAKTDFKVEVVNTSLEELTTIKSTQVTRQELAAKIQNWNFISQPIGNVALIEKYFSYPDLSKYYKHDHLDKPSRENFYFDVGFTIKKTEEVDSVRDPSKFYRLFEFKGIRSFSLECSKYYPKDKEVIELTKNNQGYQVLDQKYKIIWSVKNPKSFSFTEEEIIFGMGKAAIIASNDKDEMLYLVAILNSSVSWFILKSLLKLEGEKDMLVPISAIKTYIRTPELEDSRKREIIQISAQIVEEKRTNPELIEHPLEKELDKYVLDSYGFNDQEKAIILANT